MSHEIINRWKSYYIFIILLSYFDDIFICSKSDPCNTYAYNYWLQHCLLLVAFLILKISISWNVRNIISKYHKSHFFSSISFERRICFLLAKLFNRFYNLTKFNFSTLYQQTHSSIEKVFFNLKYFDTWNTNTIHLFNRNFFFQTKLRNF